MTIEVSPNKFVDLRLACRMEVLEFVDSLEFYHVETVGTDAIWFSLS
jgi:uncharacterized protein (DUF1499 family)